MPDTIAERVARGARLLDKKRPGWASIVRPDGLDMSFFFTCLLAQVFGRYSTGLRKLWPGRFADERYVLAVAHGFTINDGEDDGDFDELRVAWLVESNGRLWKPKSLRVTTRRFVSVQPQPATT